MNVFTHVFVRYRCVISERDNMYHGLFFELFMRMMFRFADGIIAQTTMSKERLSAKTGNPAIEVIPNPIDVRRFSKVEPRNEQKVIINLGRLIPGKGQSCLIAAFAAVANDFPEWRLDIYGAGPLKENLNKLSESLEICNRVEVHEPSSDVPSLLAKSSIFAFPSFSEGFPNSLAEAMIAGKACVSFDCDCGPRDMIENGVNGILIPIGDTNALKQSLRSLMESPELRRAMGERARELSDRLSIENVAAWFWDFITVAVKASQKETK
jgi:glycosyltransferase involved in cell wall biosynthesis